MRIVLTPFQWKQLNADTQMEFLRAAFFLGMNYMYIQNRCVHECHEEERRAVIATANELGLSATDVIVKGNVQ